MESQLPLVEVEGVYKRFCRDSVRSLRYGMSDIGTAMFPGRKRPAQLRPEEFWSLEDVGFAVHRGEAVAIGGRNGAGKTTLLRILAGLLKPDRGSFTMRGTINSVIELGQGLNPLLTGRENAELGLAWRGLSRPGIDALVPAVANFAALGEMFDTPVNSYSAGMRVRLAFAIAVSIPCDLLLLDEVLAVGDLAFQRKCIDHMQRHLAKGGALILVSHNPVQMQALCRRGILLEQGRLVHDGSIEQCIERMFEYQAAERGPAGSVKDPDAKIHIDSIKICAESGSDTIMSGDAVTLEMRITASEPVQAYCSFSMNSRDLSTCIAFFGYPRRVHIEPGVHVRRCRIPRLPLAHGTYAIQASISDPETLMPYATFGYSSAAPEFHVNERLSRASLLTRHQGQLILIDHHWLASVDEVLAGSQSLPATKTTHRTDEKRRKRTPA